MIKIKNFYSEEEIKRYYKFLRSREPKKKSGKKYILDKKIEEVGNEIVELLNKLPRNNTEEISDFKELVTMSFIKLREFHSSLQTEDSSYRLLYNDESNQELLNLYKSYYTRFFTSNDGKFKNNISLIKDLGITVCPYCNRNYINSRHDKLGCEFDHYYNKDEFPFFALTLSNLVPSCSTCNRIKGVNYYEFFPFDIRGDTEVKFIVSPPSQNSKIEILFEKKLQVEIITQSDEKPETATVKVTTKWEKKNNQDGKQTDKINLLLYKTIDSLTTKVLEQEVTKDQCEYEFTNLPKYDSGKEISYSIYEESQVDDILKLKSAYEIHTKDVAEMFEREQKYCKEYREDLIKFLSDKGNAGIDVSEKNFDSMIFGEIANDGFDNYLTEPLSKLKKVTYDYIVELR